MALNLRDPNSYSEADLLGSGAYQDESGRWWTGEGEDKQRIDTENFDLGMARENAVKNDANAQGYYEVGENAGGRTGLQDAINRSQEAQNRGIKTVEDYYRYTRGGDGSSFETVGGKEYYKGDGKTSNNFDMGLSSPMDWTGKLTLGVIAAIATAGVGAAMSGAAEGAAGAASGSAAGGAALDSGGLATMQGNMAANFAGGGTYLPSVGGSSILSDYYATSALAGGAGAAAGAAGAGVAQAPGEMILTQSAPGAAEASGMNVGITPVEDAAFNASQAVNPEGFATQQGNMATNFAGNGSYVPATGGNDILTNYYANTAAGATGGVTPASLVDAINNGGPVQTASPEVVNTTTNPEGFSTTQSQMGQNFVDVTTPAAPTFQAGEGVINPLQIGAEAAAEGGGISKFLGPLKDWAEKNQLIASVGLGQVGGFIKGAMSPSLDEQANAAIKARVTAEKQIADAIRANNNLSFLTLGRLKPTGKTIRKAGELPPGIINRARAQ